MTADTIRVDPGHAGDEMLAYLEFFKRMYMDAGLGGVATLLFVGLAVAMAAILLRHGVDPFVNAWERLAAARGRGPLIDPNEHVIFRRLASMRAQSDAVKVRCPLRAAVGREMQRIRLGVLIAELKRYVKADHTSDPPRELRASLHDLSDAVDAKFRRACEEAAVPRCAVDGYERHLEATSAMWNSSLVTICDSSRLYDTPAKRIYAAFDALDAMEEMRREALPKVLAEMNGELTASEFLGSGCENCPECRAAEAARKGVRA